MGGLLDGIDQGDERRWTVTASGLYVPESVVATPPVHPAMHRLKRYLALGFDDTSPVPEEVLVGIVSRYGWRPLYLRLAHIAALLAVEGTDDDRVKAITHQSLAKHNPGNDPLFAEAKRLLAAQHEWRPIATERSVYVLQGLALLYGDESDSPPADAGLSLLFLMANFYLDDWREDDGETTLELFERNLASTAWATRFDFHDDPLCAFVRAYEIMDTVPPRGPHASRAALEALHLAALGRSLRDHYQQWLFPMFCTTWIWDSDREGAPVFDADNWLSTTRLSVDARPFLDSIAMDVETARGKLRLEVGRRKLPLAPRAFIKHPLLHFGNGKYVPASPSLLWNQLSLGVWARCLQAVRDAGGGDGWQPTFGDMFEVWCRERATKAEASSKFQGQLHLSESVGTSDELEDVVFTHEDTTVLFSVKSRTLREDVVRAASSQKEVVGLYDSILFDPGRRASKGRKGKAVGAIRLLDLRVRAIREGKWAGIPAKRIIPVLVTYDRLGDGPGLYKYLHDRGLALGLLQQPDVQGLIVMTASEYEWLLAGAEQGHVISDVLARHAQHADGMGAISDVLSESIGRRQRRAEHVQATFDKMVQGFLEGMFGSSGAKTA